MAARSEGLFEAEAALRAAAMNYADWQKAGNLADNQKGLNTARATLRRTAIAFADLSNEVDDV